MRNDMRYVSHIPKKLPNGKVLVHNHVFPQRVLGANGFRAWTQTLDDTLEVCSCGWAGLDLYGLVHYRVKKDSIQNRKRKP
jgi:hypothetical protein